MDTAPNAPSPTGRKPASDLIRIRRSLAQRFSLLAEEWFKAARK